MDPIEAAIKAVESLNIDEAPNYAKVARDFGVDRSTLSRRHRGKTGSQAEKNEEQSFLTAQQAIELVKYAKQMSEIGLALTNGILRNFTAEIKADGTRPSERWANRFKKRHND